MPRDRSAASAPVAEDQSAPPAFRAGGGYRTLPSESDEIEAIRRYTPLVKRLAAHLKGRLPEAVQLDDLVQAGLIAILRIVRSGATQQLGQGALRRTVTNAMIDEARREAWAPVRTVRLAKAAAAAMRVVKARLGRDGSDEEVAAEMAIPLAEYHRVLIEIAGIRLLQLDAFDEAADAGLRVAGGQESALQRRRMMAALAASIAALPERERLVISLYYEHELNMEEVGRVLGFNKSTVCRAHGRALLMLRSALDGWQGEKNAMPQEAVGD